MRNSSSNIRTRVVLTRRNSCSESSAKKNGKAIDSQQALLHDIRSSLNEICKSGKEARGTSRRMGKGKTGDK